MTRDRTPLAREGGISIGRSPAARELRGLSTGTSTMRSQCPHAPQLRRPKKNARTSIAGGREAARGLADEDQSRSLLPDNRDRVALRLIGRHRLGGDDVAVGVARAQREGEPSQCYEARCAICDVARHMLRHRLSPLPRSRPFPNRQSVRS